LGALFTLLRKPVLQDSNELTWYDLVSLICWGSVPLLFDGENAPLFPPVDGGLCPDCLRTLTSPLLRKVSTFSFGRGSRSFRPLFLSDRGVVSKAKVEGRKIPVFFYWAEETNLSSSFFFTSEDPTPLPRRYPR